MLEWLARGLRQGRVTTRYPGRPEPAPPRFRGLVEVRDAADADPDLANLCPSGAIAVDAERRLTVDRGRCILCGACVQAAPERFAFGSGYETATRERGDLVVGHDDLVIRRDDRDRSSWANPMALGEQAAGLRRSIHVRHIDCGSDGSEEWEIQALWNPYYDIQRLGFFLTNAPRHADVLLVTGPVTSAMRGPLERTWEIMPSPKALIAVGTDACSGGLNSDARLTAGGVDAVLPVDVYVPGSPPSPIAIIDALLLAAGLVRALEVAP
jgi:Ni,Fe-hydrogenase III small subunit/formate hydrogenlyase subunit 6/NADH:ubiquinone oxidoreductase subunit I